MTPCTWWQRWRHGRKRDADRWIYAEIVRAESMCALVMLGRGDDYDPIARIRSSWTTFKQQPENAHWRCSCCPERERV